MINDKLTNKPISRQYKWQLRNPEKAKAARLRYRQTAKYKKWKEENREKILQYQREWRAKNPDYMKKYKQRKAK